MCRLFGQLSAKPADAVDALTGSRRCLLAQSDHAPDNLQADGWGLAALGTNTPVSVSKSPEAAFKERGRFQEFAKQTVSTAILGHLRAASNPRGIPREQLITMDNTQPFTDGTWAFAHNGTLSIPLEVKERLGPFAARVKSDNDSEVYFWHWRKHLDKTQDPVAAFAACVSEIWAVWEKAADKKTKTPYTSLNAIVTDGKSLFALCHAAASGMAQHALFQPDQPWQVMSWRRDDDRLLVASEPVDEAGPWRRLGPDQTLAASIGPSGLTARVQAFETAAVKGIR